ncbi:MAG: hypothetical protein IGBAC_1998 [Ignavibacteriae bacterium]|nr:MAG: hypothetical protein IGBAC_1998 [Ignavibacteriota bacterium]
MIKKILIICLISLFFIDAVHSDDKNIVVYGESIKYKKVTPMRDLIKNPGKYKNREVVIEGYVGAVCQTKGCWMEIKDGKDKLRVEFKDYKFFVPYDSKGKKVRIQGKIERREVKEETLKHWLEEAGEPKTEIEKIRGKQKILIFTASGVEMEGGSEFTPDQLQKIQSGSSHEH